MSPNFSLPALFDQKYKQIAGIWHCLPPDYSDPYSTSYNTLHTIPFLKANDGSFDILAQFARGNRTLDVACGDGFLEQLDPAIVGLEFSLNALKKAKKNGAQHLVLADAHHLPFKAKSFDLCICTGSFEHFAHPYLALLEMARVSRTQILIVHRPYPIPFANPLRKLILRLSRLADQPLDNPLSLRSLHRMYTQAHLSVIYEGVWTWPYNLEMAFPFLPQHFFIPSCHFLISRS